MLTGSCSLPVHPGDLQKKASLCTLKEKFVGGVWILWLSLFCLFFFLRATVEGGVAKFLGEKSHTVLCCQTCQTGIVAVPTPFVCLCQLQSVLWR